MAKTKKELGLDSMGVQKSMRLTDYLGDGLGQLPLNIMSCLVGQLTYFYTEKVGLAAGMVATMLLIAKIFDAFSDLAMGKIMDKFTIDNVKLKAKTSGVAGEYVVDPNGTANLELSLNDQGILNLRSC